MVNKVAPEEDTAAAPADDAAGGGEPAGEPADGSKSRPSPDEGGDSRENGPDNAPSKLRSRGCTDVFCLLFSIIFSAGMYYITYLATTLGDPDALLYGADYLGNRCGRGDYSNRPKIYFPRIDEDLLQQAAIATTQPWKLRFYGLCVDECPNVTDPTACFADPTQCMIYDYGTKAQHTEAGGADYYVVTMPSLTLLNRCIPTVYTDTTAAPPRCAFPQCDNVTNPWMVCDTEYPTLWLMRTVAEENQCEIVFRSALVEQLAKTVPSPLTDELADYMAFGQRVVLSLNDARDEIIAFGGGLPVTLGFAWLLLLRCFAKPVIYLAVLLVGVGLFGLSFYLFVASGALDRVTAELFGNTTSAQNTSIGSVGASFVALAPSTLDDVVSDTQSKNPGLYQAAAVILLILSFVYLIVMVTSRKKIRVAAALVKESSTVIKDRPQVLVFPFFVLATQLPVLVYFVLVILCLGTADITWSDFTDGASGLGAGAPYAEAMLQTANGSLSSEGDSEYFTYCVYIYFLFGILWALETLRNLGWTTLSGNFSDWYFFRRDPKFKSRFPLLASLGRVFRYHLGSILFGSFVIAAIQLVRIILEAIDQQTKKLQDSNTTAKLIIKSTKCCLYCFEKTVKFITNYCWVYVALQGTGFCRSCFATFGLIISQPSQLALNTFVGFVLYLIQALGIPCVCGWVCNTRLTYEERIREPIYASGVVFICAFTIAKTFATVFACVLDTLFVCSVKDKAEYKAAFMSDSLRKAFGYNKSDKKEAKKKKKAEEGS
eukprot:4300405-Prymnesium_polylepis.2